VSLVTGGLDGCKIKKTRERRKSGMEVIDGVLLQLSVGAKANLPLSSLAICLLGIA
jgi:hypothetical protein